MNETKTALFFNDISLPLSFVNLDASLKFEGKMNEFYNKSLENFDRVKPFKLYSNFGWKYNYDYTYIDKSDDIPYVLVERKRLKEINEKLSKYGLEEHTKHICSILQIHEYRLLFSKDNKSFIDKNANFKNEICGLFNLLNQNVEEIKFVTARKRNSATIKSKHLIQLLFLALTENVFCLKQAFDIFVEKDVIYRNGFNNDDVKNDILSSTIFNLLLYLQKETDYRYNNTLEEVKKLKFSNKQLELIYDLMEQFNLIEGEIGYYNRKDYIRNKIKRSLRKSKEFYLEYFNKDISEKMFEDLIAENILSDGYTTLGEKISLDAKETEEFTVIDVDTNQAVKLYSSESEKEIKNKIRKFLTQFD